MLSVFFCNICNFWLHKVISLALVMPGNSVFVIKVTVYPKMFAKSRYEKTDCKRSEYINDINNNNNWKKYI